MPILNVTPTIAFAMRAFSNKRFSSGTRARFSAQLLLSFLLPVFSQAATLEKISSPDGRLEVHVSTEPQLRYQLYLNKRPLSAWSNIFIELESAGPLSANSKFTQTSRFSRNHTILNTVRTGHGKITQNFNQMRLHTQTGFSLDVRVYNDGWAFRSVLNLPTPDKIYRNDIEISVPNLAALTGSYQDCAAGLVPDCFHSSYENLYSTLSPQPVRPDRRFQTPLLFTTDRGEQIVFLEADTRSFPGTWLQAQSATALITVSPGLPLITSTVGDDWGFSRELVSQRSTNVATVPAGLSELQWRAFQMLTHTRDLMSSDMVERLTLNQSPPLGPAFTPGFATNEWIIDGRPQVDPGKVGFIPGLNTATYKYYVDFAAHAGLRYITLDAGWSAIDNLDQTNPEMDVPQIIAYAKAKNIGIIIWTLFTALNPDLAKHLDKFRLWGAQGVKVDFIERDDQLAHQAMIRIAAQAEKRDLFVFFHGASKPTGLNLRYPAIANYEAGRGHEYNKFTDSVTPRHKVDLAFMRSWMGPFDWVGAPMHTVQPENFVVYSPSPMGQGTMASQIAPYVFFTNPVPSLAGDPEGYKKHPALTRFLTRIPTVWDETRALHGVFGEYAVIARRHNDMWYIAGLNTEGRKTWVLDVSWLPHGNYQVSTVQDSWNSDVKAMAYDMQNYTLPGGTRQIPISMARNGGFVLALQKKP